MKAKQTGMPMTFHLTYGVREGGLWVDPEDEISTWIPDAHGYDTQDEKVAGSPNLLAVPFLVRGAMPGDTLVVTIHQLKPNRNHEFACKDIHPNAHHPSLPLSTRRKEYVSCQIDIVNQTDIPDLQYFPDEIDYLPLRPVLGCIGMAPSQQDGISSKDCGIIGGNMDCPRITAGATIYLPVCTEYAYLYLGDGHALQGDGEITGNGIEVSFDVIISVSIDRLGSGCPAGEDDEFLFTMVNDRPLEKCLAIATDEMFSWLTRHYGLDRDQTEIMLGHTVRFDVGNLVSNPCYGACCFPKKFLPSIKNN